MRFTIDSPAKDSPLNLFIRRAYSDLSVLKSAEFSRIVNVANTPYCISQLKTGLRVDGNWLRPINRDLFISDPEDYLSSAIACKSLLRRLRQSGAVPEKRKQLLESAKVMQGEVGSTTLDRFLYTTVQATGCVYDIANANAQRSFGLLYQSFVHTIVRYLGFKTDSLNILVPKGSWDTSGSGKPKAKTDIEKVEVDMVIGPLGQDIKTSAYSVWPEDSFATIKSSTKERISQVFIDAVNIQRLSVWRIARYILFVHNDVQRTSDNGVSSTFLPTNFTGGSKTFPLSAIYFSDMPRNVVAKKEAQEEWARLCRFLSEFITKDIWI